MGVNLQTENFLSENYQEICQVQQRDAAAFRVLPCQDTGQAQGCSVWWYRTAKIFRSGSRSRSRIQVWVKLVTFHTLPAVAPQEHRKPGTNHAQSYSTGWGNSQELKRIQDIKVSSTWQVRVEFVCVVRFTQKIASREYSIPFLMERPVSLCHFQIKSLWRRYRKAKDQLQTCEHLKAKVQLAVVAAGYKCRFVFGIKLKRRSRVMLVHSTIPGPCWESPLMCIFHYFFLPSCDGFISEVFISATVFLCYSSAWKHNSTMHWKHSAQFPSKIVISQVILLQSWTVQNAA